VALAPMKAAKRGAQSTPWSVGLKSPPPPGREEVEPRRAGHGLEAPRPQGPVETALVPGAMPPPTNAGLGGAARPAQIEEGRAIVASNMAPEAAAAGGKATPDGARAPCSSPTSTTQREGPDLFWTIRRRLTSGRVWTRAGVPTSRRSTKLPSS